MITILQNAIFLKKRKVINNYFFISLQIFQDEQNYFAINT